MTDRRKAALRRVFQEAIQRETDAFNYYQKSRLRALHPETDYLLLQLAEEERKHRAILLEELRKVDQLIVVDGEPSDFVAEEHISYRVPDEPGLRKLQAIRDVEMAAISLPMEMIGGDFLDTVPLERPQERRALGLFLYDVMGHGLDTLQLKARAKEQFTALRESWAAERGPIDLNRPGEIMRHLNHQLYGECQACRRFVTALYSVIDPVDGALVYTSAGHEPPILIRANGEYVHLSQTELLLCVSQKLDYSDVRVPLETGDVLVFYSDGITEAMGSQEEMFGRARVRSVVQERRGKSASEIAHGIVAAMRQFLAGEPLTDEVTLVVMKIATPSRRAPGPGAAPQ